MPWAPALRALCQFGSWAESAYAGPAREGWPQCPVASARRENVGAIDPDAAQGLRQGLSLGAVAALAASSTASEGRRSASLRGRARRARTTVPSRNTADISGSGCMCVIRRGRCPGLVCRPIGSIHSPYAGGNWRQDRLRARMAFQCTAGSARRGPLGYARYDIFADRQ